MEDMIVKIEMADGGLEIVYENVKTLCVKTLAECARDGEDVKDELESDFFNRDSLFVVFKSDNYHGVYPLQLCTCTII